MEPKFVASYNRLLEARLACDALAAKGIQAQLVDLDGPAVDADSDLYEHRNLNLSVSESDAAEAVQCLLLVEDKHRRVTVQGVERAGTLEDWAIAAGLDPGLYGLSGHVRRPWWRSPWLWLRCLTIGALALSLLPVVLARLNR